MKKKVKKKVEFNINDFIVYWFLRIQVFVNQIIAWNSFVLSNMYITAKSKVRHLLFRKRQIRNLESLFEDRFWLLYTTQVGDFVPQNGRQCTRSFRITRGQEKDFVDIIYNQTSAVTKIAVELDSIDCFRVKITALWL